MQRDVRKEREMILDSKTLLKEKSQMLGLPSDQLPLNIQIDTNPLSGTYGQNISPWK